MLRDTQSAWVTCGLAAELQKNKYPKSEPVRSALSTELSSGSFF